MHPCNGAGAALPHPRQRAPGTRRLTPTPSRPVPSCPPPRARVAAAATIPGLPSLQSLDLSGNTLSILRELEHLQPLANLNSLSIAANPLSKLPHTKDFAVYHLRQLSVLDREAITMEHRSEARERFDRPDASVHPGSALGGPEAEKIQRNSARLQSEVRACVRVCKCVSVWYAGPIRVQSIHEWTVHGPSTCRYYDAS
jgi:hypothetical protein